MGKQRRATVISSPAQQGSADQARREVLLASNGCSGHCSGYQRMAADGSAQQGVATDCIDCCNGLQRTTAVETATVAARQHRPAGEEQKCSAIGWEERFASPFGIEGSVRGREADAERQGGGVGGRSEASRAAGGRMGNSRSVTHRGAAAERGGRGSGQMPFAVCPPSPLHWGAHATQQQKRYGG